MTKSETVFDLIAQAYSVQGPMCREILLNRLELYVALRQMETEHGNTYIPEPPRAEPEPSVPDNPQPTGLETAGQPDPEPEAPAAPPSVPPVDKPNTFMGKGAAEKRTIFERLQSYKENNGVGCLKKLADASNNKLSVSDIRDMLGCGKYPLQSWLDLNTALDAAEESK